MSKNNCKCDYCLEGKVHKQKELKKIADKETKQLINRTINQEL